ncbi:hypothetical protein CL620_03135 [archaeon]|nr:hypothetical protein [archaeon]
MASPLDYLTQGSRIFFHGWKARFTKKRYSGNADEICRQIVKECWNGTYFQTSTGNFPQFWTRDFGWCTSSLLKLGYTEEVYKTLRYALNNFQKKRKVTTTLTKRGTPFDFPTMAVDSLPWLIHSIKISKFSYHTYRQFLNQQIHLFFDTFIDVKTGLVKMKHFSSIKDFAIRKSSCYDNCVVAMLAKDLTKMKLDNPFAKYNYPALLKKRFWNGSYFYDDLQKKEYVAGDANIFPFVLGIIGEKAMMESAVEEIEDAGLADPFPLKYTSSRQGVKFIHQEIFLRNYESHAIWMHMGPLYMKLLKHVDKELYEKHKKTYTELIETHGNFLEVFTAKGKPFSTPFYYCDAGMLWAANYLVL